jgi:hypothetical protein
MAAVTDAVLTAVASAAGPSVEKMSSRKRGHNSRTQRRNARGQFAPEPVFIDIYPDVKKGHPTPMVRLLDIALSCHVAYDLLRCTY